MHLGSQSDYCLSVEQRLGKSQAAHPHCLGVWGECFFLRLVAVPMVDNTWVSALLVGLINERSESFPRRLTEGGSVFWFLLWFASGICLLLHGLMKFNFSPDSISLKNAVEFPCCTNLPGYFGSSFSSLFLHLHQVDTETRTDCCCF